MVQILLAEDNPADVVLVQHALKEHQIPHQLHVVRDGEEAVEFIKKMGTPEAPCPDVVLLDLNLPKVPGPEVLAELRSHPTCAETPVIVVTSSDLRKDRARVAHFGVAHYFRKPSDFKEFMGLGAVIRGIVEEAGPGSDSSGP